MKDPDSVWITGASSGMGRALALLLAARGVEVIATARDSVALAEMAKKQKNLFPLPADLINHEEIERLRSWFSTRNRPLDAVVVNAGTCLYMDDAKLDMGCLRRVFEINLFAAASTIDLALPYLERSPQGGHLVGISSMTVYLPFTRAEYYGASKAAFTYYLQSLAVDLAPRGIDVSIIYPGFVDTPLTQRNNFPMPFLMSTEAAAERIVRVLKNRPKTAAFPDPMHYLLRIIGKMPWLWHKIHKPNPLQTQENAK
jgi:short-subunit dehydrogenase